MRPVTLLSRAAALALTALLAGTAPNGGGTRAAFAQAPAGERAPYLATPPEIVGEMLKVAKVTKDDVVYDLGCGDGRIVIAAARRHGARGVCVDINPQLMAEARENARKAGVADRIEFVEQDLFESDLKGATVVTLFLTRSLNLRLRPKLMRELKPGTRVVSHAFDMGDWKPARQVEVNGGRTWGKIYYWVIPRGVGERVKAPRQMTLRAGIACPFSTS